MLKCTNLSKEYPGGHGVHGVSLEVKEHEIFALLGPNGSGKSTLMKMITGLIWPTGGEVTINGHDVFSEHSLAMRQVGAVIEWPSFIPYLTARQNLKVFTGLRDDRFLKRMTEVVELVEMAPRLDDKVQNFSTGMKQRLGLALALLPDSRMIILDEPANGLDPNGIIEIRRLIRDFNRDFGTTVIFTSHLLGEVEQICTRLAIIHKGRIVADGNMPELLGEQLSISITADPLHLALKCISDLQLNEQFPIRSVDIVGERIVVNAARDCTAELNSRLVARGIRVSRLVIENHRLESYFARITEGETDVK